MADEIQEQFDELHRETIRQWRKEQAEEFLTWLDSWAKLRKYIKDCVDHGEPITIDVEYT